jgi:hypothetical protein
MARLWIPTFRQAVVAVVSSPHRQDHKSRRISAGRSLTSFGRIRLMA